MSEEMGALAAAEEENHVSLSEAVPETPAAEGFARVACCPVCARVSRPRTFNVDAWDCVRTHIAGVARNGCEFHRAAQRALMPQSGGLYGCPACDQRFATCAAALSHFFEVRDAAHESYRHRQESTTESDATGTLEVDMEQVTSSQRSDNRGPVAGATGWEIIAEAASRFDPAAYHREHVVRRAWESRIAEGLYAAAKAGDKEATVHLLNQGTDPNQRYDDGYTALMTASEAGHERIVEALMSATAIDVNARNNYGQTALHFAAQNGQAAVVRTLLKNQSIDVETVCGGRTPAEVARAAGCNEVADVLATTAAATQMSRCLAVLSEHGTQRYDSTRARVLALCAAIGIEHAEDESDIVPLAGSTCSICLVAEIEAVMSPCSHACCCMDCASQMIAGPCPVCRQHVLEA
eukprot:CAMPEP_0115374256 /NCGR_PEP_ID=MMETSP0271-20121206/1862_1 /TAXON_ID=71861 /ORGANISM="Scrippsiella trochoidea, Strain CCMP3099" /LENGTH=407 /DNA_ID=CAMNT_0002797301 /DNA_START=92 /DNA_END=1312 /DNA_ORIENTATION=+